MKTLIAATLAAALIGTASPAVADRPLSENDTPGCVSLRESRTGRLQDHPYLSVAAVERRWEVRKQGVPISLYTVGNWPVIAYRWCDGAPGDYIAIAHDADNKVRAVLWHRARWDNGGIDNPFDGVGTSRMRTL